MVMPVNEDEVRKVKSFKYLRFFVQENGGFEEDVKYRIRYMGGSRRVKHLICYAIIEFQ